MIFSDALHKGFRLLILLQVVQDCINVQCSHLCYFIAPGADHTQELGYVAVAERVRRVQLQDEQSYQVLILEQLADLQQLALLILAGILQCLPQLLVEVVQTFINCDPSVLILHDPIDQIPHYHRLQKHIQLHRRFHQQQRQKLAKGIQLRIVFQYLYRELLVVFDELVNLLQLQLYLRSFSDQCYQYFTTVAQQCGIALLTPYTVEQFLKEGIGVCIFRGQLLLDQQAVGHAQGQQVSDLRREEVALSFVAEEGVLRHCEILDEFIEELWVLSDDCLKGVGFRTLYKLCEGWHLDLNVIKPKWRNKSIKNHLSLVWVTLTLPTGGKEIRSTSAFESYSNTIFYFLLQRHLNITISSSPFCTSFTHSYFPKLSLRFSAKILDYSRAFMRRVSFKLPLVGFRYTKAMPVQLQSCLKIIYCFQWAAISAKQPLNALCMTGRMSVFEAIGFRWTKAQEEKKVRWQVRLCSCGCVLQTIMQYYFGWSVASRQLLSLCSWNELWSS